MRCLEMLRVCAIPWSPNVPMAHTMAETARPFVWLLLVGSACPGLDVGRRRACECLWCMLCHRARVSRKMDMFLRELSQLATIMSTWKVGSDTTSLPFSRALAPGLFNHLPCRRTCSELLLLVRGSTKRDELGSPTPRGMENRIDPASILISPVWIHKLVDGSEGVQIEAGTQPHTTDTLPKTIQEHPRS